MDQVADVDGGMRWSSALAALLRDLALFTLMCLVLQIARLVLIVVFHHHLGEHGTVGAMLSAMLCGLRFDARIAVIATSPSLLASLVAGFTPLGRWTTTLRWMLGAGFVAITTLLLAIDLGFFAEYDDQFNNMVLGVVYDDLGAVLKTIWAEHHVVLIALAYVAWCAAAGWATRRLLTAGFFASPARIAAMPTWAKTTMSVALIALVVFSARGSVWRRPVQRKDIAVTADPFLNKLVVNPYKALQYAIEDHLALMRAAGIGAWLPDADARAAAKRYFATDQDFDDLDRYCLRTAPGAAAPPPRHIFLVVMESYSAWPMLPAYRSLALSGSLSDLAARGTSSLRFISAGNGTMASLGTIISGLQECGVMTNYQPSSRVAYPTSLPAIFHRLGYRTRFFYAGFPSWQRIGPFARDQGFDEVYGGGDMGANWLAGKEWGVDDDRLLDFTAKTATAAKGPDADLPSLNVIMTVSNHPPYGLDVDALGFPLRAVPADLTSRWDGSSSLRILGHFWYADHCLGEFVKQVEAIDPGALFAITGDHYGRRFVDANPTMYERLAVPFVLYGPAALAGRSLPAGCVGGHLDMIPTLVDLAAPAGFAYHALGRDLFMGGEQIGLGRCAAFTADGVVEWLGASACEEGMTPELGARLDARYRDLCGISWWRIMRGAALPASTPAHTP